MQDKEQQFEQLFHAEYGPMYRAARLLLGSDEEAKDAIQDVFAQLWEGSITLRQEGRRAFLLTCVRNRCLNIIARSRTEHEARQLLQPETADEGTRDDELAEAVDSYIDQRLTHQTGRIIRMHYEQAQSYKDIAGTLGISLSAVNKHIVQGLKKLRTQFKDRES